MRVVAIIFAMLLATAGITPAAAQDAQYLQYLASETALKQRIEACSTAIEAGKLSPQEIAAALNMRGLASMYQGDAVRGLADFTRAISANPADIRSYINRGNVYDDQGDFARAI